MLHLDPADMLAEKAFRLQVKERLYRFNFVSERRRRLVCWAYLMITGSLGAAGERREAREAGGNVSDCQRGLSQDPGYGSIKVASEVIPDQGRRSTLKSVVVSSSYFLPPFF